MHLALNNRKVCCTGRPAARAVQKNKRDILRTNDPEHIPDQFPVGKELEVSYTEGM